MKKLIAVLIMAAAVGCTAFAGTPLDEQKYEKAVESLLIGLNSDNTGLKTSSAFMLGELKASEAVVPLLKMLRNDANEESRIVAALALYKIGSGISINALKQASRFDGSERVRKICAKFYSCYYTEEAKPVYHIALR